MKILMVLMAMSFSMVMSASLLDFLTDAAGPIARDTAATDSGAPAADTKRNCLCNGPSCICCVDFNMSFIDLGGPGCVRMNYLSPEEGIAINVSYGDSLLHSQTVRGPDPAPTCLNIFSRIAQMCARFSHLLPTDDGLRGCVILEPKLLGTTQIELPIGCFRMGPNGMQIAESSADIINEQIAGNSAAAVPAAGAATTASGDDDDDGDDATDATGGSLAGYSTADILAAVSDSAEEGIALLSNWFGLATAPTTAAVGTAAQSATNGTVEEAIASTEATA